MQYLNVRTMEKSEGLRPSDLASLPSQAEKNVSPEPDYTLSQVSDVEVVENTILQTTNYKQFRLDPTNRPIDMERLHKLCDAITAKNLLHLFPIVVTEDFTIIDGQHRHRAAELLEVPIFYVVSRAMTMEDAATVASNTKAWTMQDWLHHWCERGAPEYLKLREFWAEHRWMSLSTARILCQNDKRQAGYFSAGKFVANRLPFARQVAVMAKDFQGYFKAWNSTTFINTLAQLAADPNYSHKHMMMKMEYLSSRLVRCPTVEMYLALITEIYNYKARGREFVTFRSKSRLVNENN